VARKKQDTNQRQGLDFDPIALFPSRNRRFHVAALPLGGKPKAGQPTALIPLKDNAYDRTVRLHEALHSLYTPKGGDKTTAGQAIEDARLHLLHAKTSGVVRRDELATALIDLHMASTGAGLAGLNAHNIKTLTLIRAGAIMHRGGASSTANQRLNDMLDRMDERFAPALKHALRLMKQGKQADAAKLLKAFFPPSQGGTGCTDEGEQALNGVKKKDPMRGGYYDGRPEDPAEPQEGQEGNVKPKPEPKKSPKGTEAKPQAPKPPKPPKPQAEPQPKPDSGDGNDPTDGEGDEDDSEGQGEGEGEQDGEGEGEGDGQNSVGAEGEGEGEEEEEGDGDGDGSDGDDIDANGAMGADPNANQPGMGAGYAPDSFSGRGSFPLAGLRANSTTLNIVDYDPKRIESVGVFTAEAFSGKVTPDSCQLLTPEMIDEIVKAGPGDMPHLNINNLYQHHSIPTFFGEDKKAVMFGAHIRAKKLAASIAPGGVRVFEKTIRRNGGTVLIDCSGSMAINNETLQFLLNAAPMATVGCYRGCAGRGELAIYAHKGRRAADLRGFMEGGGNEVDFQSLQWLLEQEGPRYFCTDCGFCDACGGPSSRAARMLFNNALAQKKFKHIPSVLQLLLVFEAGKHGKDPDKAMANPELLDISQVLARMGVSR
jgi:hypothetical protein